MKVLDIGGIPTSLGEIINIKYHLDLIKSNYSSISLGFQKSLWNECLHTEAPDWEHKKTLWNKFLSDIGNLFFSEYPYTLVETPARYGGDTGVLIPKLGIMPHKAEMGHLLCKGTPLDIGEYIVITTKVRWAHRRTINPWINEFWNIMRSLATKYKIVILGERIVEMRKEYGTDTDDIFSIYNEILHNIPADRILDLTLPALGETVSDLTQIQQDCLIMRDAKFVVTMGVGGNFCMSTSVGKMSIGFRSDRLIFTDRVFGREYPNAIITKNYMHFLNALRKYC